MKGLDSKAAESTSSNNHIQRAHTLVAQVNDVKELNFDVMKDPDYPETAVKSDIVIEEIEVNGQAQKIIKKTYTMIEGHTKTITRVFKD